MFRVLPWEFTEKDNALTFQYESARLGLFSETVVFPDTCPLKATIDTVECQSLIDLAAFYLGVSYYKAVAESVIASEIKLTESSMQSVVALYTEGLGEFYARNELAFPPDISFEIPTQTPPPPSLLSQGSAAAAELLSQSGQSTVFRPIVAFGGGKDSHVAVSLLQRAGVSCTLVSVVLADAVKKRLAAMTDQKIAWIERQIDPRLITLSQGGSVYNGHIPITAINSSLLCIMALCTQANAVVFANERGASVPTRQYQGHDVNHQYSKSLAFEQLYRQALWSIAQERLDYFSLLRGYSELWIARYAGTQVTDQHERMASCNRNFVFSGPNALPADQRWCGQCSKCVFSAIIFAPHMNKQQFLTLFGTDILNDPANLGHAKDLTGLGSAKPWECVGAVEDTASSIAVLSEQPEWADSLLVTTLIKALPQHYDMAQLKNRFKEQLVSYTQNCVPERLHRTLLEAL